MTDATPAVLPLQGITVADFSRHLPGPWCTEMLSDFGAAVLKVEQSGTGDVTRYNAPNYAAGSVYFNNLNMGKRSMTLDLTRPEGRQVAHRLLAQTDVMIESYRPDVSGKLGIDYDTVAKINPRLIYCSITGFGQVGPLSNIPGHDLVIQAMTGLMRKGLHEGETPRVPGHQSADFAGGAMGLIGVLVALQQRNLTGKGCRLDISMFDSLMVMNQIVLTGALARQAGASGQPEVKAYGENPRYATYRTRDGKAIAVCLLEAKLWREFCTAIGRPDLVFEDETWEHRLSTHGDREHLYRKALTDWCAAHDRDEIFERMRKINLAILPVLDTDEALAADITQARGLVQSIPFSDGSPTPYMANPLRQAGLARSGRGKAPALGEHNDAVLAELGYSEPERAALRAAGAL